MLEHSLDCVPDPRGGQRILSASLCWIRPSAGGTGSYCSLESEECSGKWPDSLQLWSESSHPPSWRYLCWKTVFSGQLLTQFIFKKPPLITLNSSIDININSPTYATLSVTMYLLWLTLVYGISDWFPTGTMYSFWNNNKNRWLLGELSSIVKKYLLPRKCKMLF